MKSPLLTVIDGESSASKVLPRAHEACSSSLPLSFLFALPVRDSLGALELR